MIRIPLGVFTFIGPMITVLFVPRLEPVILVLLLGRILGTIVHMWLVRKALSSVVLNFVPNIKLLSPLLRMGGWMTVTNIVGPVMVNLDRFVIGGMLSLASVTYYATPYEMVTKLLVIGGALSAAYFPLVSSVQNADDLNQIIRAYNRVIRIIVMIMLPVVVGIILCAYWGLSVWLTADFALKGAPVLKILAIGVLFNSIAGIPFATIQGLGRPDLTAILHLIELPIYLVLLLSLIQFMGIFGAALAWTIRASIDSFVLAILANTLFRRGFK